MTKFLLGLGIGLGIGVLFAPGTRKQRREQLSEAMRVAEEANPTEMSDFGHKVFEAIQHPEPVKRTA